MPSKLRIAFLGFRHGHILAVYKLAQNHPDVKIVATCDEEPQHLTEIGADLQLTHSRYEDVLSSVPCDLVAIGDYYGRRGSLLIQCLSAGKHVISDKPVCTSLAELKQIEQLASSRRLVIGCQLDLRCNPALLEMRKRIRAGEIGEIHTLTFTAQHPLLLDIRPKWYFEPGKQGGTLNDIGIHGAHVIPWLTGRSLKRVVAARAWNARLAQYPHFQDAGQFMLELDNGGGVLADVSYFAPDGCGYSMPQYWRITCHGESGVLEARVSDNSLFLARSSDKSLQQLQLPVSDPGAYFADFLSEVAGRPNPDGITTAAVLRASRDILQVQEAADQNRTNVPLA